MECRALNTESTLAVSIIIPVWNTGEYLDESVQSALAELDGIHGEVIIVDDQSDDDHTLQLLECYKTSWPSVNVILNDTGIKGAGAARNCGISQARGEWLLFLDSDDVFIEGCVAKRLAIAKAHPQLQWMSADFYKWYPPAPLKGNGYFADKLQSYPTISEAIETKAIILRKSPVNNLFDDYMPANTLVVMIKRDLCRSLGGFSTSLVKAEDTFLWLKLAFSKAPFAFVPYPVAKYRIRVDSLTHEDKANGIWKIALYKMFYRDPSFSAYRKRLRHKISKGYLSDSYYYREKGRPAAVITNALLAIYWNPAGRLAWKNVLAGFALALKLVKE
tara:strand:+ start:153809 stop:154804 length:996 start_codon:yes stop_codon:yes gene_type:complete